MSPLFATSRLTQRFGGLTALEDVDLVVEEGSIHSVIGPNGAGKTTLFNCVTGIHPPTSGRFTFDGRDLTGRPPHVVAARGISRTFQNIRLFREMTVLENAMVGAHVKSRAGWPGAIFRTPWVRREEAEIAARARAAIAKAGLAGLEAAWARNLSYGDQRRLEIARALAAEPKLLLLDEPAAGMNPEETGRLMALIRAIRDGGVTIVLIEHHMKLVMEISDRITVLDHGVKICEGPPGDVRCDAQVIEAYLGAPEEDE